MPRTKFRPETDSCAFSNTWTFDSTENATLTSLVTDAIGGEEWLDIDLPFSRLIRHVSKIELDGSKCSERLRNATTDPSTERDSNNMRKETRTDVCSTPTYE